MHCRLFDTFDLRGFSEWDRIFSDFLMTDRRRRS